jgi:hypothetical protein
VQSPTAVVDIGDELTIQFIDQVQEGMAVEVDPDKGAGDAALIAGERAGIGRTQRVNRSLLTGKLWRMASSSVFSLLTSQIYLRYNKRRPP